MGKVGGQKLKILRIYQILLEQSDEQHPMNAAQIGEALKAFDIPSERKSIYNDMQTLMDADIDLVKTDGGYYIGERSFELAELKLLVDAVGASKFISAKKSKALLDKIESLVSVHEAKQLSRQVVVPDRVKTDNEKIFYTIDAIYQCIDEDKKLSFQYEEWTADKKKVLRHDGMTYVISPAFLIRNDENYYLVAYDEKSEAIRHYRVDKMVNAIVLDEKRGGVEIRKELNQQEYAEKHIGMFAGSNMTVTIKCHKKLVGVVIDKFGSDITIRQDSDEYIKARVTAAISDQFYGWLAGIRGTITSPDQEAEKYKEYLLEIVNK